MKIQVNFNLISRMVRRQTTVCEFSVFYVNIFREGVKNLKKAKWVLLLTCIVTILTLTIFQLNQIHTNYLANLETSESCIKNNGTVVIADNGFLSLTSVYCE